MPNSWQNQAMLCCRHIHTDVLAPNQIRGLYTVMQLRHCCPSQPAFAYLLLDGMGVYQLLARPCFCLVSSRYISQHPLTVKGPAMVGTHNTVMSLDLLNPALTQRCAPMWAYIIQAVHLWTSTQTCCTCRKCTQKFNLMQGLSHKH